MAEEAAVRIVCAAEGLIRDSVRSWSVVAVHGVPHHHAPKIYVACFVERFRGDGGDGMGRGVEVIWFIHSFKSCSVTLCVKVVCVVLLPLLCVSIRQFEARPSTLITHKTLNMPRNNNMKLHPLFSVE